MLLLHPHTRQAAAACLFFLLALVVALAAPKALATSQAPAVQSPDPAPGPLHLHSVLASVWVRAKRESLDMRIMLLELMRGNSSTATALGHPADEVRALLYKELCARASHPSNQMIALCAPASAEQTPLLLAQTDAPADLNPVIMVPGLMGTRLNGTWHKRHKAAFYCTRHQSSWIVLWVNLAELFVPKCLLSTVSLVFDKTLQTFVPPTDVNVQPAQGLDGADHLVYFGNIRTDLKTYLLPMQKHLMAAGYTKKSMDVFGYDWRLGTDWDFDVGGQTAVFQKRVETLAVNNGNRPVYIVSHSMGGVTATAFLNRMSPRWRAKYIAGFVPISMPMYGATKALLAAISGGGTGLQIGPIHLLPLKDIARFARTIPGNIELAPSRDFVLNNVSVPIVQSPARNYSYSDYSSLWETTLHEPEVAAAARTVAGFLPSLQAPQVPVYCMHGYGLDTIISLRYRKNDLSDSPHQIMGDGDGTVPIESLTGCMTWSSAQSQPVTEHVYSKVSHSDIVADNKLLTDLVAILTNRTQDQS